MSDVQQFCGWVPDHEAIAKAARIHGSLSSANPFLAADKKDTFLWNALRAVHPQWRRGAQGIGDCVSWGAELAATCLMALQHVKGTSKWIAEAATEPIYGGCRVEALGKRNGSWSDGAFGYAAAKWLKNYGVILRQDYSKQTGNGSHDYSRYDSKRAKSEGYYGAGGQKDGGKIDAIAKQFPCRHVVQIKTVEEAAAAIGNGYPITIASMYACSMKRDANGLCYRRGQWAHQMCVLGTRYRNSRNHPDYRIFQSWGPRSCSGPDPGIDWDAVSGCSWWCPPEDFAWILRSGDCWAIGDVEGFPEQSIDVTKFTDAWYSPDNPHQFELAP